MEISLDQTIKIDLLRALEINIDFDRLKEAVLMLTNSYTEFWDELIQNKPDNTKLQSLGSIISRQGKSTQKLYETCLKRAPYNIKLLVLFGSYQRYVQNNEELSFETLNMYFFKYRAFLIQKNQGQVN